MFYVYVALCAVISYLIGGINGAIIMSSLFFKADIRTLGSGNPGFTNFKRNYGWGLPTALVILTDVLKTVIPVLISMLVFRAEFDMRQFGAALSMISCMIGHCFPVWYRFKGGKAVLALASAAFFVSVPMSLIALAVFLIVIAVSKYMSLASCSGAICCPIALAFIGFDNVWVEIFVAAAALTVIVRHRQNFRRLANGTESKFTFGNNKKS